MVYIGGAYDSKDYGAINHFETPQKGVIFKGITKKDTHPLDFDVTLCHIPKR